MPKLEGGQDVAAGGAGGAAFGEQRGKPLVGAWEGVAQVWVSMRP